MKKIHLIFLNLFCVFILAKAQQIPNGGFENWTTQGPFEMPEAWDGRPSASKSTDMHSGNYAIKFETATFTNPQTSTLDTLPGVANTGMPGTGPGLPGIRGFASNARPDSLTGWYKYSPVGLDSFVVRVVISKWNSTNNSRDEISNVTFFGSAANNYTRFSFPIHYLNNEIPDTIIVELINTLVQPPGILTPGTILLIDDLAFVGNVPNSVSKVNKEDQLKCFPNPANESITISNLSSTNIVLMNQIGKTIKVINTNNLNSIKLDVSEFDNGIYFIKQSNGATQKISIIR
ncbi:MAG: T9SS type A sorting domain-containing protein [Bacteroidota bacterium]